MVWSTISLKHTQKFIAGDETLKNLLTLPRLWGGHTIKKLKSIIKNPQNNGLQCVDGINKIISCMDV